MGGACGMYGEAKTVYRVMVRKPEGKRPLGRRRLAWEVTIKVDLKLFRRAWNGIMRRRLRASDRLLWAW